MRVDKIRFFLKTCVTALFLVTLLYGCGGDNDDVESSPSLSKAYNGPGSKWDVELYDDASFVIMRRETYASPVQMTVNGTYETLDSGFFLLTVSSSTTTDDSTGPAAGDQAYALEVPGYAFILKPISDDEDNIIPMVTAGECPSTNFNANWVSVNKDSDSSADDADRDFFGSFSYTATSATAGSATLPSKHALSSGFPDQGANALGDGTCTDGLMEVGSALMYLTSNGGAIVQPEANEVDADGKLIFALTEKAISSVAGLDGDYAGLLFDGSDTESGILPVSISCTSGTCAAAVVTDVANNTVSTTETASLNLLGTINDLGDGLVTGTVTSGSDAGNIACMVDENVLSTGRKLISCVGQSPGDNTELFNVLFTSKL